MTIINWKNKITREFQQQKNEAMQINEDAVSYNAMKAELDNQKRLLDSLLKKRGETSITAQMQSQTQNNIRIIDRAQVPKSRTKPNIKLNMLLALAIGLFGGIGLAFFIDYLDDKVRSIEDIEHFIKLPLLGLIPLHSDVTHHKDNKKKKNWFSTFLKQAGIKTSLQASTMASRDGIPYLLTHTNPKGLVAEAFRVLRTSLLLSRRNGKARCILITSTQPKEGKTFVSANLAIALAQVNK